jgi:uncharacterized membrane protein YedE/YeeE
MYRFLAALAAGLVFGSGLALSGMTHAEKVLGFLDVSGQWDPSLLFVFCGALGVTLVGFRYILRRDTAVLGARLQVPTTTAVDRPLIVGAVVFGIGWGLAGYCPGPGLALLAAPSWETWVFLPAFFAGTALHRVFASTRE